MPKYKLGRNPFSFTERQAEIVKWCRQNEEKYPQLKSLYSIPSFNKSVRKRQPFHLEQQGFKRDMPGLCLPVSRGGFTSFYIETEQSKEQVGPRKEEVIKTLIRQGAFVQFAGVVSRACNFIELYLSGKIVRPKNVKK